MSSLIEIVLDKDIIGVFIGFYLFMVMVLGVSLINIYDVDKIYFQYNFYSKYFTFKHKMFFIYQYDKKNKNIVSKRTFFMEIIWYFIFAMNIGLCIGSLFITFVPASIILGIDVTITLIFGSTTGTLYAKAKRKITSDRR